MTDQTTHSDASGEPVASGTLVLLERHLRITTGAGEGRFHYVWLRDNCWCDRCRVKQTTERQLFTADIPADVRPASATRDDEGTLQVLWRDGHSSAYTSRWLAAHDYSEPARAARRHEPVLWDSSLPAVPAFEHAEVVGSDEGQLAYLEAVRDHGIAIVHHTPTEPGEVERFAEAVGHVRETAFERIHNVRHDPRGYSVAHTTAELRPHTDMPSYHWPPSIQLLHFLANEATGGESTMTDGWAVLADLRRADPDAFATLCRVPVRWQVFSDEEDTAATSPLVQLDAEGRVTTFRYSNHLAQPLDVPFEEVEPFYDAYRTLGRMIADGDYTTSFRTVSGDLLTVHGHRVLHGRLGFDAASGARHLQDVYMEYDDLMSRRRVLLGQHRPLSALPG